jgi:type VI secretion system secreted protein VgrG
MPTDPTGPVTVTTPLGPGILTFSAMRGVEELGRPFTYVVDLLSKDANIALKDLLGQTVTVNLELEAGAMRHFHGHVVAADFLETAGDTSAYRVVLRPWLSLLSHRANCRIFQHKTTPEIVKQIFSDGGFTDVEDALTEQYPAAEYVVQYRESDLAFVSRLLERAGIYYYFNHTADAHTLVLADSLGAHSRNPRCDKLPFRPQSDHHTRLVEHVDRWELRQAIASGKVALRDFDFERPRLDLTATRSAPKDHAHADAEVYDYPGGYIERADGESIARLRLEQTQASYALAMGHTNARALSCGALLALEDHPRDDQNVEYLVVRTAIALSGHALRSLRGGAQDGAEFTFSCDFGVIDSSLPFRPEPITPKPVVEGPQTAMVVGKKGGQDIWTDQYGRIKVQFHWDREGKSDENSSCWVRVSQAWAGPGWGSMHLPHAGQEVIVSFLEGDPDRPIVTGRVYDGTNTPWQALPAQQRKSYFRDEGGNHIMMDATKGKERIELYSPYAKTKFAMGAPNSPAGLVWSTLEDATKWIAGYDSEEVGKDQTSKVGGARKEEVAKDKTSKVGGDHNVEVNGNHWHVVKGTAEYEINGHSKVKVGERQHSVTVGENIEVFGGAKIDVCGGAKHESMYGLVTEHSKAWHIRKNDAGKREITSKVHEVEAKETLLLKGGGEGASSATLDAESVKIYAGKETVVALTKGKNISIHANKKVIIRAGKGRIEIDGTSGAIKVDAGKGDVEVTGTTFKANGNLVVTK